jgi:ubiquinone biosynthesis protein
MRSLKVVWVLSSHLLFHRMTPHRKKPLGVRLRESCEQLGPVYIKLGQMLSLRYDLLDPKDGQELQNLLDNTPSFDYAVAREIIKHDLGRYPEDLFAEFGEEPIACASISQVYKARLKSGEPVAVKVRRPWIGKMIEKDMAIIRRAVSVAQFFSPKLRKLHAAAIIDELQSSMLQEIDFRYEAKNLKLAPSLYGYYQEKNVRHDLGRIIFPRVHDRYSSYNVLTTEFLEGVPLTQHGRIKDDPAYNPRKSVFTLINAAVRVLFQDGHYYFHADPHPANIIAMKGGDIGLLDFGIVGEFTPEMTKRANDLFFSVYARDSVSVADALMAFAQTSDPAIREALMPDVDEYLQKVSSEGMGYWFIGAIHIFTKHSLRLPRELALLGRSYIILDGVVHIVAPGSTTEQVMGEEFKRGLKRRIVRNITEAGYSAVIYKLSEKARKNPEIISAMVNRYADDPARFVREMGGFA